MGRYLLAGLAGTIGTLVGDHELYAAADEELIAVWRRRRHVCCCSVRLPRWGGYPAVLKRGVCMRRTCVDTESRIGTVSR